MSKGPSLRDRVAIAALRGLNWASRAAKRGAGTVAGGRLGLALSPDLLASLARGRSTILVSGTNGKTTTTALVAAGWGGDVVTNETGSNMPPGHVAALAGSRSSRVVLEVDEAWLGSVLEQVGARVVVLLNLSRDQLDRANEVRKLADRWRHALARHDELVVVANANDPLVVWAASDASNVRWCDVPTPWLDDARSCPQCTLALEHVGGTWRCSCGFAKPTVVTTSLVDGLVIAGTRHEMRLALPGAFNEANAAMALTALVEVGEDAVVALARMSDVAAVAGRFTLRRWSGRTVRLLLAKNPAGFDALLSALEPDASDVWIAINARVADGHDPSWLYDVPFEKLRGHLVWCLGDRRLDLATRLHYAEVSYRVVDDVQALPEDAQSVPLIANYTAFSEWLARTVPC
ncbi:MAG: MurT ligase domain-containing protein [Acidimicrobiales bacterium]